MSVNLWNLYIPVYFPLLNSNELRQFPSTHLPLGISNLVVQNLPKYQSVGKMQISSSIEPSSHSSTYISTIAAATLLSSLIDIHAALLFGTMDCRCCLCSPPAPSFVPNRAHP